MKIRIIITGGTFDKQYDEIKGELGFKDTHLPKILEYVRCTLPMELEINQLIDSLDMHMSNRLKILESCRKSREKRIVITHGTDTMIETASILGESAMDKTVVLTGAMVPYQVANSDALFNLGCAVAAVQILQNGVYVVMNGRIFHYDNVVKVKEEGIFIEKQKR